MTWFKVDDDLAFHRKVVSAGNAAMGLWVRAGAWCAQHLTDGFVPDDMVSILGTPSQRSKLVKAGLWVEVPGGCQFHEWNGNGRQPTAQSVREKRDRAAERQAKHRAEMYAKGQVRGNGHPVTHASVTGGVTPLLTPPPTRPDPSTSSNEEVLVPPTADAGASGAQLAVIPGGALSSSKQINGGDAVAAWCESYSTHHDAKPTSQQTGQVGREANALLKAGNPPERVLIACRSAGARGFATVQREYGNLAARNTRPQQRATTDVRVEAGLALADKYDRQETG